MNLDIILKVLPIVTGILGFSINGFIKDKENKKLKIQIEERDERLRENEMYEKVRSKHEVFEESMADLTCLDLDTSINEKKRAFIKVCQKYNALYNEVEDFCTKVLMGL